MTDKVQASHILLMYLLTLGKLLGYLNQNYLQC